MIFAQPAWGSDDGTATITIETPPPEPPTLVDPTGTSVRPGGCTPVFLITFPEHPMGTEHMSDSGQSVTFDGTVCDGWGTDAIRGAVDLGGIEATAAPDQPKAGVSVIDTMPPALEARLTEAIQTVESAAAQVHQAASPPAASPPPRVTSWPSPGWWWAAVWWLPWSTRFTAAGKHARTVKTSLGPDHET